MALDLRAEEMVVLLNTQARRVGRRVKNSLSRLIPRTNLYLSQTKEEAYVYLKEVLDKRIKILFSGGGDGTLAETLTMIKRYLEERGEQFRQYVHSLHLGILGLGTGNGWAAAVGGTRGVKAIRRLLRQGDYSIQKFHVIEAEGRWFHFSGLGWDAKILNDYMRFKEAIKIAWLRRRLEGFKGYMLTLFFRTIPSVLLRRRKIEVTIKNLGRRAYRIDPRTGEESPVYPQGSILYQGKVNVIGVSSVPYYGYKLKAFPFAQAKEGLMNLRLSKAGVFKLIVHAGSVWRGTFRSPDLLDYLVEKVELSFSEPMPLQIGGDPQGYVQKIEYAVAPYQASVIDFNKPVPVPIS
jgi:diacylglycerol kinase family enzyme